MRLFITIFLISCFSMLHAQSSFEPKDYTKYLESNKDMSKETLLNRYPLYGEYYSADKGSFDITTSLYYDSIVQKLNLNADELKLLKQNHFLVTERHSRQSVLGSLDMVYCKDLPVMITTDVLLHALHNSYDNMLQSIEITLLEPNLSIVLKKMHDELSTVAAVITDPELQHVVKDAELFVVVARMLLDSNLVIEPQHCSQQDVDNMLDNVYAEQMKTVPLFTYSGRKIDFSQFKPRGHYTDGQEEYFRSMIWLSFINILLTKPEQDDALQPEDIKRMSMLAFVLNDVLYESGASFELNENDEIIKYFVGESDNLTPYEFKGYLAELDIDDITKLKSDSVLEQLQNALLSQEEAGQKILSGIIMTNPLSAEPAPLPISYKLFGQRFVIDSYVLHNLSYDQITYKGMKVMRMMPDPLDVMFCLGNNNAIHLEEKNLDKYPFASAADAMRYLYDSYDAAYWSGSLYNIWLKTIKSLSKADEGEHMPFYTKTVAWQHEKLNSQLASWSQLRHDNILYAKQSYTGGVGCSYPHGYVEPYPEFFLTLKMFAEDAARFMSSEKIGTNIYEKYWTRFAGITDTLLDIVISEVNGEAFNESQITFIQSALKIKQYGVCGAPPVYDGWLPKLFWNVSDASEEDYTVADVHTQPTDEAGNMVGKVLHTGVGDFDLGVFIAPSPSSQYKPMIFCGPTLSYYQFETTNFVRKNDEEWKQMLWQERPARPEWTNIYLANREGKTMASDVQLKGVVYTGEAYKEGGSSQIDDPTNKTLNVYFSNKHLVIENLELQQNARISIYDLSGHLLESAAVSSMRVKLNTPTQGMSFYRIENGKKTFSGKLLNL